MGSAMKLVTWSLATFHATVFVLAIVLFAYSRGARDRGGYPRRALRWGAANGMSFLAILAIVAVLTAIGNTRLEQVPSGILFPALLILPIAFAVSSVVGGAVGALFGIIDLALFALAGLSGSEAEPTV
jgi:hypothetical protein